MTTDLTLKPHDELMTPGCANCAVKHLSAAVARIATHPEDCCRVKQDSAGMWCAVAFVNLVEVAAGYASHRDYAIGCLHIAEERAVITGEPDRVATIRDIRIGLVLHWDDPVNRVWQLQKLYSESRDCEWIAHICEAYRELTTIPPVHWDSADTPEKLVAVLQDRIGWIRMNYFESDDGEGKGGEDIMACKKKCCAAKGGATAKKAGKSKVPAAFAKPGTAKKGRK